jgi:citrate synthase
MPASPPPSPWRCRGDCGGAPPLSTGLIGESHCGSIGGLDPPIQFGRVKGPDSLFSAIIARTLAAQCLQPIVQACQTGGTVMQIGKTTAAESGICRATADGVEVHGRDLVNDLMGRLSFTDYFHLLLTGREPSRDQRDFLDLLLIAIAEHGMMPTAIAARMTLAAEPNSLQGALAAGLLGCGPVLVGTSELCAQLLSDGHGQIAAGAGIAEVAAGIVGQYRESKARLPGFGHPVHRPVDPRAERILALADQRKVSGPHVALARAIREAVHASAGKPIPMNVSMPIAAVMLDLGFAASVVKAVPLLARTAGLLGHLAEEQENPLGFYLAGKAEEAVAYNGGRRRKPKT